MEDKLKVVPIMLPTDIHAANEIALFVPTGELVLVRADKSLNGRPPTKQWIPQQLYLVSEREIKEGDWFHDFYSGSIMQFKGEQSFILSIEKGLAKRCEAATDKSLGLSLIPESFVREWVEKQGKIECVYLELEFFDAADIAWTEIAVKNGEVIIFPIKEYDDKAERNDYAWDFYQMGINDVAENEVMDRKKFDDWFEKNY